MKELLFKSQVTSPFPLDRRYFPRIATRNIFTFIWKHIVILHEYCCNNVQKLYRNVIFRLLSRFSAINTCLHLLSFVSKTRFKKKTNFHHVVIAFFIKVLFNYGLRKLIQKCLFTSQRGTAHPHK